MLSALCDDFTLRTPTIWRDMWKKDVFAFLIAFLNQGQTKRGGLKCL